MAISTRSELTPHQASLFFLAPESALQRQYEALRCYFVEGLRSVDVARRFGYSPDAFRSLCYLFRHDPDFRARFLEPRPRARAAPVRDRVREMVVAMRKKNLSVYDIERELAEAGHAVGVSALSVLLREEGFSALPRRRDEERRLTVTTDHAEVADVRRLDLMPRSFRTRVGGLLLFVPLMRSIDLKAVLTKAQLPGSVMIPAEQALRALLALKLIGIERKSHVMDLVFDPGIALFAGLNVVPKRSYLAAYSSSVDRRVLLRLMQAWFDEVQQAGLPRGASFDLDFHTVPTNSDEEPLERHYVSSRSRRQQGILTFLARDATERVLCYANAGIPKAEQASEIARFVEFWKQQTGSVPVELVFDSQLTTYTQIDQLNEQGIRFITLRRRSKRLLEQINARPVSAWKRISLPAVTRAFRTPKVLDERVRLTGYTGELRQVTITELGHEEPTVLLTNHLKLGCVELVTRYAQRMLIENAISEAIQFFHIDALSSMVGMKVDFDLQLTLMASSLYRLLAGRVGREYERVQAKRLFRNLLDVSATVEVGDHEVVVTIDKRAHNPFLIASGLADEPTPMPWFGGRSLRIRFG
jgi:hypothetical protein